MPMNRNVLLLLRTSRGNVYGNHRRLMFSETKDIIDLNCAELKSKRRLVFSIGYIGTNYRGLQKSNTRLSPQPVPQMTPTVEDHLEQALHAAGCISDMNLGDLDRLGWSRMARTDKVIIDEGLRFLLLYS
jgi:hypothetical protein